MKIVVGIDGSAESTDALRFAAAEAGATGADLLAVTVWEVSTHAARYLSQEHVDDAMIPWMGEFIDEVLGAKGCGCGRHDRALGARRRMVARNVLAGRRACTVKAPSEVARDHGMLARACAGRGPSASSPLRCCAPPPRRRPPVRRRARRPLRARLPAARGPDRPSSLRRG